MRVSLRLYKLSTDHLLGERERITSCQLSAGTSLSLIAAITRCLHRGAVHISVSAQTDTRGHLRRGVGNILCEINIVHPLLLQLNERR